MLTSHDTTAAYSACSDWQYAAVVIAIDTRVPAQMADEPARAVLASYVSHN